MTRPYARSTPVERFGTKVDRDGPVPGCDPSLGRCHVWIGARSRTGYGYLRVGDRSVRAHRFAWEHVHGPVPDGLELDHLCRNRACVRVSHLEMVERAENLRRGRVARGVRRLPCSVDGCSKTAHARGWCPMHYQRQRRGSRSWAAYLADRKART